MRKLFGKRTKPVVETKYPTHWNHYKILKPIPVDRSIIEQIEKKIQLEFRRIIFDPLIDEFFLPEKKIYNAEQENDLIRALESGTITYSDGAFRGRFNSKTTKQLRKLGATWSTSASAFVIREDELSTSYQIAVAVSKARFEEKLKMIDYRLSQILPEKIAERIELKKVFDLALFRADVAFKKNVQKLIVPPQLTDEMRAKIAEDWQTNMELDIKRFTEKEIISLRKRVQESTFAGNRYESLVKGIRTSYNVTHRKAKFLARQETNLLLAKFKETRYTDANVNEYIWGCVHMPHDKTPKDHIPGNVRYSHGILEDKIFRWDRPPVTTPPGTPARRNNPGQDFNCRCFARPIIRFGDKENGDNSS